jgi:hypothetical protein
MLLITGASIDIYPVAALITLAVLALIASVLIKRRNQKSIIEDAVVVVPKRNVLLIDDLRNFRETPEDANVVIARTSAAALVELEKDVAWDEIWFDHDLGEPEGVLDTTMPVVDFLSERAYFDNPVSVNRVIVHTSNSVGRDQITQSLRHYGYSVSVVDAKTFFIV